MRHLALPLAAALCAPTALAANVAAPAFAWSENAGWVNFAPAAGPGVTVSASAVTGYAWSENLGWIHLSPAQGGVTNDGIGRLAGHAWSENAGWIRFRPAGGGVSVDGVTGRLQGLAWSENAGWISFAGASAPVTAWRPDPGTFDPLADTDGDGIPNNVELAERRDPFARDNDVFGDARLFAMQQYRDFLSREGDAAGIDAWTGYLAAGGTRARAAEAFLLSPEFQAAVAPVARLYFAYFLRYPDYPGLSFWIDYFQAGNSLAGISQAFAASPEFAARYGSLDDTQFVTLVYRNVLGREPEAGGLAFWTGQLAAGMARGTLMTGFSESPEYGAAIASEVFVTAAYTGMLRRAPDPGGFAYWVGQLDAGNAGLALVEGFLAAPEYRGRFLP